MSLVSLDQVTAGLDKKNYIHVLHCHEYGQTKTLGTTYTTRGSQSTTSGTQFIV